MKNRKWKIGRLALALAIAGSSPCIAAEAQRAASNNDPVTLNFVNAEIEGVVKAVSEITGRNFVVDPRVKGLINIISSKPMSRSAVYEVFLSALRLQGFAAIDEGAVVKIMPEADAKLHLRMASDNEQKTRAGVDQVQTRIFKLTHESASQVMPILRPLISPNNTISVVQNSNSLVITDYASNMQRIERVIDILDQAAGSDPIAIALQHASAVDVAQTITRMFAETGTSGGAADPSRTFNVVADARSNSILAR